MNGQRGRSEAVRDGRPSTFWDIDSRSSVGGHFALGLGGQRTNPRMTRAAQPHRGEVSGQ